MSLTDRLAAIRASARRLARSRGQPAHLTPAEVDEVRRAALRGESVAALAERYGVSPERVRRCAHNRLIVAWDGAMDLPELKP